MPKQSATTLFQAQMNSNPNNPSSGHSLEGRFFSLVSPEDRRRVIDLAFDYRGDVTIELQSGERLEGYLYDRDPQASPAIIKLFPKGQSSPQIIPYEDLVAINFSGEDTAFGKSWEDWINKLEKVTQKKTQTSE